MKKTDKEFLVTSQPEPEVHNGGILFLETLSFLLFAAFIAVSVFMYMDIKRLDNQDELLQQEIQGLINALQTAPFIDLSDEEYSLNKADDDEFDDVLSNLQEKRGHKKRATSFIEAILIAQETVFEKLCKNHNDTCPSGTKGDEGPQGDSGLPGKNGTMGQRGTKGPAGDPGAAGYDGSPSDNGARGPRGHNGTLGPVGDKGAIGPTGLPGLNGTQGDKGVTGTKGRKGPAGYQGPPGLQGYRGPQGVMGVNGSRGHNGTLGDRGPQGVKGPDVRKFADDCQCKTKPTFRSVHDDVIRASRDLHELPCHTTGNPTPTLSVYTNGETFYPKDDSYVITRPEARDYGVYTCIATNEYGSVTKNVTVIPYF